jgi:group I intron endonuclease
LYDNKTFKIDKDMKFTDEIPSVCCVYKITNTINNLIIIGSTTNLNKRINHYRNDMKKSNPLKHYNRRFLEDIINYGLNSFVVDIIEEYTNKITDIELKNNESKYILQYNSINPEIGYNIRLDIDGKYICNDSTKKLKSEQLKFQWQVGIRDSHSDKMSNYWTNNEDRRMQQANVMRKVLTKYVYNVLDAHNNIVYNNLTYNQLAYKGLKAACSKFKKDINIVRCKGWKVERIILHKD